MHFSWLGDPHFLLHESSKILALVWKHKQELIGHTNVRIWGMSGKHAPRIIGAKFHTSIKIQVRTSPNSVETKRGLCKILDLSFYNRTFIAKDTMKCMVCYYHTHYFQIKVSSLWMLISLHLRQSCLCDSYNTLALFLRSLHTKQPLQSSAIMPLFPCLS